MPFDFSYNGTPYYLETTKTYNIAITNTGTPSEGIVYKISDTSPNTNLPLGLVLNSSTGTISGTTTFGSITTLTNYIIDASAETQIDASANIGILVDYSPEFIYPATADEKPVALLLAAVRFATSVAFNGETNENLCTVSTLAEVAEE